MSSKNKPPIRATGSVSNIGFSSSATARTKTGLSALLMTEAWTLASYCKLIEEEEKHLDWPQPRQRENIGHASASVILAAASLEAAINEIYLQAVDGNFKAFPSLAEQQVTLLASLWDVLENSRASMLKKYEMALTATQKTEIPRSGSLYQSASGLVKLRDLLVHFKPEWGDELDRHLKLQKRLESEFEMNQLSAKATGNMLWFPGKCLGAGCARWACHTALNYHKEFSKLLDVASRLPEMGFSEG